MRKLYVFGLAGLAAAISGPAAAEQITLTTYYPAPYGVYKELRAKRMAIGDEYYDGSQYSWEGAPANIDSQTDLIVEGRIRALGGLAFAPESQVRDVWAVYRVIYDPIPLNEVSAIGLSKQYYARDFNLSKIYDAFVILTINGEIAEYRFTNSALNISCGVIHEVHGDYVNVSLSQIGLLAEGQHVEFLLNIVAIGKPL